MPLGTDRSANTSIRGNITNIASAKATWVEAVDNASTAQSGTELLKPSSIDDATFHWIRVGDGVTRCIMRARCLASATGITSPVVRLVGMHCSAAYRSSADALADPATRFVRLDNDDWNAVGKTLTLVDSGTNLHKDANDYMYSNSDSQAMDLQGCAWVGVMVQTAAAATGGTVSVELLLMN